MEKEGYPEPREKKVVVRSEENAGQENNSQGEEPGSHQAALSTPGMGVGVVLAIFALKNFRIDIEQ